MLSFTLSGKTYTWTANNIDRHKLNRILDLLHIISCIMFFASFLYFHVHFLFMFVYCAYIIYFHISYTFILPILYCPILSYLVYFHITYLILSYTFISRILSYYLSYTVLYFHISYTFILPILYCHILLSTFLCFSYTVLLYAFI